MSYNPPTRLGFAPIVVAAVSSGVPIISDWLSKGGYQGGFTAEKASIDQWVQQVGNDLNLATVTGQTAWMYLRCWANDPGAVNTTVRNPAPCTGCGDGGGSGGPGRCQQYAAQAVAFLRSKMAPPIAAITDTIVPGSPPPAGGNALPPALASLFGGSGSNAVVLLAGGALLVLLLTSAKR